MTEQERADQVRVIRMVPAPETVVTEGLTAFFTIEVGRLIQIDGVLFQREPGWSVKLTTPRRPGDRIDFAPPAGRKIVRDAVVSAWEAFNAA